jgi:hypothetical protein
MADLQSADVGRTGRYVPQHNSQQRSRGAGPLTFVLYAAAVVILTLAEYRVWVYVRARGVVITGDEPHYLVLAAALSHFTVHVLPYYQHDFLTHTFYSWPAGATLGTRGLTHTFTGPHGTVSAHGLGVPAILAPFLAVGGKRLAFAGLFAVEAVGFAYLHWRVSGLAKLSTGARIVFAVAMAGPAVWLAATQIYPDLIAGILIACAVAEVAAVELTKRLGLLGALVVGGCVAYLPWLHTKNIVPAALVAAAFAWATWRTGHRKLLIVAGVLVAGSWLLLLGFDLYYFGRVLGYPQPLPKITRAGLALSLGLLFDRQQGLFVQVPAALLGFLGLWRARRVAPLSAVATLAAVLYILLVNGSYIQVPYGGSALAGRFQWTIIPLVLIWVPWVLQALETRPLRLWGLGAVVAALYVLEGVPIVRNTHVYYSAAYPLAPWDPGVYPGWWGYLDTVLGRFYAQRRVLGAPWFALLVELAIVALACWGIVRLWQTRRANRVELAGGVAAAVLLIGVLPPLVPQSLPSGSLSFTGSNVGRIVDGSAAAASSPAIALQGIGSGTFVGTLRYHLTGPTGSASFTLSCPGPPGSPTAKSSSTAPLAGGAAASTTRVSCPAGLIWYQATVAQGSKLAVDSFTLTKTSN